MSQRLERTTGSGFAATLRRVAEALATPLVPQDYLDMIDPLGSGGALQGRIVDIQRVSPDAVTVTIRPGADWAGHQPGQWVRVGVDVDGVRHHRAYSITSVVGDGTISITPKAIPEGKVSNHLVRDAQVGDMVQLEQAVGEFCLPDPLPTKVLFITAGSGLTPVLGMLRNHLDDLADVVVIHSAPSKIDVIAGPELRRYAADGRLRLVERHTDTQSQLDLAELDELVPDWRERPTWVCGPAGLLEAAEDHWAHHRLDDHLHVERFRPVVPVPVGDGGTISFTDSGVETDAGPTETLLDAGEAAGVLMPSGCRMGICFSCVAPLRSGSVRDLRTGEVTSGSTDEDIYVQTCINAAAGNCRIDL